LTTIQAQVRQFIRDNFQLGVAQGEIAADASFMDAHLLDSTAFLELVTYLEETFAIKIADEEMAPENLDSLDAIAAFVARKTVA
jgi:acyl carrier protein